MKEKDDGLGKSEFTVKVCKFMKEYIAKLKKGELKGTGKMGQTIGWAVILFILYCCVVRLPEALGLDSNLGFITLILSIFIVLFAYGVGILKTE